MNVHSFIRNYIQQRSYVQYLQLNMIRRTKCCTMRWGTIKNNASFIFGPISRTFLKTYLKSNYICANDVYEIACIGKNNPIHGLIILLLTFLDFPGWFVAFWVDKPCSLQCSTCHNRSCTLVHYLAQQALANAIERIFMFKTNVYISYWDSYLAIE